MAARGLHRRGHSVLLLEARNRVGGRVHATEPAVGCRVELGGQFLGPGQDRAHALAAELGLRVVRTRTQGSHLMETTAGRVRRWRGIIPRLGPVATADVALALHRFERLAATVHPTEPWRTPRADRLDAQTLAGWIDRVTRTGTGRRMFRLAASAVWAAEPEELSLLHALFYARAAGSLRAVISTEGGAQQGYLGEGAHRLATRVAEELGELVRLGEPVDSLSRTDQGVQVTSRTSRRWDARYAVVAVPPTLVARIHYDPPLPADRDALLQRLPMGTVVKTVAVYPTPFWRAAGLSGQALSLAGPIAAVADRSPPDGPHGVLVGFVEGPAARTHLARPEAERRSAALDGLARLFGPAARQPLYYLEQDWSGEPFSRGGYSALFPPGAWTQLGPALRRPAGRIHWTGTETATRWYGYIDGAIRSGEQTADTLGGLLAAGAEG